MEWDLVEIDPGPEFVYIVFFIQFIIFVFSFLYFLYVFVDALDTKRKLHKIKIALQEIIGKNAFQEEAIHQKEIFRSNRWLGPMIDHFICYCDVKNADDETKNQKEILSIRAEKYLKNIVLLKWMVFFSFATAFFIIYDQKLFGYGLNYIFGAMIIPVATILFLISVIFLKRHFIETYKQSFIDLQQSCPAPGIARPAG